MVGWFTPSEERRIVSTTILRGSVECWEGGLTLGTKDEGRDEHARVTRRRSFMSARWRWCGHQRFRVGSTACPNFWAACARCMHETGGRREVASGCVMLQQCPLYRQEVESGLQGLVDKPV